MASARADTAKSGGGAPVALEFGTTIPDFEAKDLSGKTWRLADLMGKATFIDVWAQWCGVCRGHHPELQRLYDLIKGRADIQMLSFNNDDNVSLATAYVKEKMSHLPGDCLEGPHREAVPDVDRPHVLDCRCSRPTLVTVLVV